MGRLTFLATPLDGLVEIATDPQVDERGSFVRLFCEGEFDGIRAPLHFTQANLSRTSHRGTVRGMHFQRPPHGEAKLIRCIRGKVFDVAVDIRIGSPTYLQWHAVELSDDNERMVFIPEGFAHGFQALTDEAHLLYMHTASWTAGYEGQLRFNDPVVGVEWPLPPVLVSSRDQAAPSVGDGFEGVTP
ncbi:dTDP-4-dehydrorhamnose 3,5-epimerase [Luteibacter sp.]|uniref:dTDP-4-dehydrorhamnose 3,5-epimerase n=1 Tax=Luteibacter sp. TaxID=1886636 RepID=UPI003F81AA51